MMVAGGLLARPLPHINVCGSGLATTVRLGPGVISGPSGGGKRGDNKREGVTRKCRAFEHAPQSSCT